MKKLLAMLTALAAALIAHPLFAGVILSQEITTSSGSNTTTDHRTVMVQGNRQKVEAGDQSIILDLDAGKMVLLNPASRTYTELPFPPHGQMAAMMQSMGGVNLNFKKTGKTQTLSGYRCQEYDSHAKSTMGEFSAQGCFSSTAPGAATYASFSKTMARKFEEVGMATTTGTQPDGIPMELETTTKLTGFNLPGVPPEQAERLKQMMANRPPTITKSVTTSVKTADLQSATFAIPAGYTERRVALGGPPMGAPTPAPTPYEGE
jgi:hypothetical protein